jgi:hypothetical protein
MEMLLPEFFLQLRAVTNTVSLSALLLYQHSNIATNGMYQLILMR